jgi:tetratricopeptide (TPR) repeat protein
MEGTQSEFIDRYLRNDLAPEEKAAFEAQLSADPDFRKEVELHRQAVKAIRQAGRESLKRKLALHGIQADAAKKKPVPRWWWLGLISMIIIVVLWWARTEKAPSPPVPPPVPDSPEGAREPEQNTSTPEIEQEKPSPPVANKQAAGGQLFAEYFSPYKDPSLEPSFRGNDAPTPYEQFLKNYWDGNYAAALETYETLGSSIQENANNRFLKAMCLMETGRIPQATPLLEGLLENGAYRFSEETPWYLALCYLHAGEKEKARDLLKKSSRSEAQRLLRQF